jgi:uncharacterized membrane protein
MMTTIERIARRIGRPRVLLALLVIAFVWIALNLGLPSFGIDPFDAFPFRWLQRASIVVNTLIVFIVLQARGKRHARVASEMTERALRDGAVLRAAAAGARRRLLGVRREETRH